LRKQGEKCALLREESALTGSGRLANIIYFNDLRINVSLDAGLERLRKK